MKGSGNIQNEILDNEHAYVNGVGVKKVVAMDGLGNFVNATPTAQTNPSLALTYDVDDQLTGIAMTIGATTYNRTLTWVGGVCTAVSVWSEA